MGNKGLIGHLAQKALDREKEKEEVKRFGTWKEISTLCICLAEQKLLSAENIMTAFVGWKFAGASGFQVFACFIEAGRKHEMLDSLEFSALYCRDIEKSF